jgi:hypothetical protein
MLLDHTAGFGSACLEGSVCDKFASSGAAPVPNGCDPRSTGMELPGATYGSGTYGFASTSSRKRYALSAKFAVAVSVT